MVGPWNEVSQDQLSPRTLRAIEHMGYSHMTHIQAKTIPALLSGRDVMGHARTGSGKTLAFVVPAVQMLVERRFTRLMGTGCLILSPTRELSLQM